MVWANGSGIGAPKVRIISFTSASHVHHDAAATAGRGVSITQTIFDAGRRATSAAVLAAYDATVAAYRQRRMGASVLLVKALGGGWDVADLPRE